MYKYKYKLEHSISNIFNLLTIKIKCCKACVDPPPHPNKIKTFINT